MEKKIYCVYQHIRPDTNEVFYIGIGLPNRPYSNKGRNIFWKRIYKKNNKERTVQVLISDLTWNECCQLEIGLITYYGRKDQNKGPLCNLTDGGDGTPGLKMTLENKEELRQRMKGNSFSKGNKTSVGRWQSEDAKRRISEANKGNLSNTGKIWINNGVKRSVIFPTQDLPEGWKLGYKLI